MHSALIRDILAEAGLAGKSVTGHVEKYNPALRRYRRLGFNLAEDRGVHWFIEWDAKTGMTNKDELECKS